jgi:L-amino acid N-acyltransferase YncA
MSRTSTSSTTTPAAPIRVRPVDPSSGGSDIPAIAALYGEAVLHSTASWEYEPPNEAAMQTRVEQITLRYPFLVAEEIIQDATTGHENGKDGEVVKAAVVVLVGYAYANAYRTRAGYRYVVEDSIYVKSGHHGRGIGSALLRELIDQCTQRGFRQMIAVISVDHHHDTGNSVGNTTTDDNDKINNNVDRHPSIRLHQSVGFRRMGHLVNIGYKFGRWLDSVQMQRSLGDGASTLPSSSLPPPP